LPQLNLGSSFGVTAATGTTHCVAISAPANGNCAPPGGSPGTGEKAPFGGIYGDALRRMLDGKFYNYAAVLSFEMPLDNAAAKAALAQAHISYEQARLQYRQALSQSVLLIESAIGNLQADVKRVEATREAAYYAEKSLRDEQVRFRVGMATTHDLLQFQSELVTAQGNQVTANTDLENARLALWHAEGTLLPQFNIDFTVQSPHLSPWYSKF
jgi:outer membrane protein